MAQERSVRLTNSVPDQRAMVIEAEGLIAEYSTGCTPTGEWFALGTIVQNGGVRTTPAWVVVGTGATADEAVHNLTVEVRGQARASLRI